jgi:hypothetical protein
MGSRLVRVRVEDIDIINDLSGLGPYMPFSAKVHAILARLKAGADLDALRQVVREELHRFAGVD